LIILPSAGIEMAPSTKIFDVLWDQTHRRLCGFICSRVSNEQDAEDILQDVYFRVYHQLETVRDPGRLESWMYQIARNRIIDHYRGRREWVDIPETLPSDEAPAGEISAAEGTEDLLSYLREVIETLPEAYREALVQADINGLAQQDVADRLGITLSGAKSRVQRARQKVKGAMLRCFEFEFDARGQIMDYSQHCCC
jgi:RNA polymerase sigma-70 factor, ECF subfamily